MIKLIITIPVILIITGVIILATTTTSAQAQTQNFFATKSDLQIMQSSIMSNLQSFLQSIFATKTELHDSVSSISKDLQTLKDNQNNLFDSLLKQMSNDTISLQNRITALEQQQKGK